jgi:hypothetical protein
MHIERQKTIILMVIGLFVIVIFAFALNNSVTFNRLYSDIFLRWYATTKLFSEGRNLYDPRNAAEMWQIAFGKNPWGYETNFFYPAHLLIFTAPLALLPYQTAHLIWTIVIQIFYFASLLLSIRHSKWPSNSTTIGVFLALNAISLPFIFHTIWGQFNTIGMLGLVLCFLALCDERYALAGAFAVSLTFKPQNDFLVLLFLLFWSLWQKKRWPFIFSFGVVSFLCWLFAELLQPGWVMAFIASLDHYTHIQSIVDQWWNPGQVTAIALVFGVVSIFFWKKEAHPTSVAFMACLTLSMAVWDLIVPIYGWVHSVLLVLAIVWLVPLWKKYFHPYGNYPIYIFVFLFVFGWLCFFLNFLFPDGNLLAWSEATYKALFPIAVTVLSIPLLWKGNSYD